MPKMKKKEQNRAKCTKIFIYRDLKMRKIKSSSFTARNEKLIVQEKEKSRCVINVCLYGKITVHASTFIKKVKQM